MSTVDSESSYKVFLSMDISGSTDLKYRVNSAFDWGNELEDIFATFHIKFINNLEQIEDPKDVTCIHEEITLWKFLGDELIYIYTIESRKQLHYLISAFWLTLNSLDIEFCTKYDLRLTGNIWGAEFPIQNRIIKLTQDYIQKDFIQDYVGPDMDIGFRIAKESCPGLLTLSMDIVTLLAQTHVKKQIEVCLVRFVNLKGVWNQYEYPIFWARLHEDPTIELFEKYEKFSYTLLNLNFVPAEKQKDSIEKIRGKIETSIKLIRPYIPAEDTVPEEYKQIIEKQKNEKSWIESNSDNIPLVQNDPVENSNIPIEKEILNLMGEWGINIDEIDEDMLKMLRSIVNQ